MLTRHERKDRLGYGGLKRVAARCMRADGKPYSVSRVSQVLNCEKTGQRNAVIEAAVVDEINGRRYIGEILPTLTHAEVFPPVPPKPERVRFPGLAVVGE